MVFGAKTGLSKIIFIGRHQRYEQIMIIVRRVVPQVVDTAIQDMKRMSKIRIASATGHAPNEGYWRKKDSPNEDRWEVQDTE